MKLTVIIGSTVETYTQRLNFFNKLEKKFKCKIKKKNYFEFKTTINNHQLNFIFCYKPKRNQRYESAKIWWKKEKNRILPPPAEEIIKKIKKPDRILTIGFCGGFKGKINEIYLPYKITKKTFPKGWLTYSKLKKINSNPLDFGNFLIGGIKGKKSKHLTTDLGLMPTHFKNKKDLVNGAKELGKKFDTVDTELYVLVKPLMKKFEIGSLLISSDVLNKEKLHMQDNVNKMDWNFFVKTCFQTIKICLNSKKKSK